MRFSASLVIASVSMPFGIASFLDPSPTAYFYECFKNGALFGNNRDEIVEHIAQTCYQRFGNRKYNQFEMDNVCYDVGSDMRVVLMIHLSEFKTYRISPEDCFQKMKFVVENCQRGGLIRDVNWDFIVDPNIKRNKPCKPRKTWGNTAIDMSDTLENLNDTFNTVAYPSRTASSPSTMTVSFRNTSRSI
ncbi:hypothetical protein GGS21DRAFT_507398 [Xylaria nigripes]|nr:hypothetical protein GGS21DRAFT_507398 [Xylaria nigripes]